MGSVHVHAALLAVWVIHSLWEVETLSPPSAAVTLLAGWRAAAPISPPPVPEPRPRPRPRRIVPPAPVTPPTAPVAAATDRSPQPAPEPDSDGDDGPTDSAGSLPAGGPAGDGPPAPAMLPIEVVRAQL